MSQTAIDNRDLQEDEVLSLSNIYNPSEFSYSKESTILCYFNVFPCADNSLKLENIYEDSNSDLSSVCIIKYLPPVRIELQLPIEYPTEEPPNFHITTTWLSPWQISLICQKLDEIWLDNKNQEVYHGVTPCSISSKDSAALIEEYEKSDKQQRKLLVQKYGRRQIQLIVERHLTQNYIKNNAKPCPKCSTMIEKHSGCNRMICSYCNAFFCWLCGLEITTSNPYDHFWTVESTCHRLLFAGEVPDDLD